MLYSILILLNRKELQIKKTQQTNTW